MTLSYDEITADEPVFYVPLTDDYVDVVSTNAPLEVVGAVPVSSDQGATFDGAAGLRWNDALTSIRSAIQSSGGNFCVEAWFRASDIDPAAWHYMTRWGWYGFGIRAYIYPGQSEGWLVGMAIGGSGSEHKVETYGDFFDDQWHHVAFNSTPTSSAIYVDGVHRASSTSGHEEVHFSGGSGDRWGVGIEGPFTSQRWIGNLKHVAVYDKVLSPSRISAHANTDDAPMPPWQPGLDPTPLPRTSLSILDSIDRAALDLLIQETDDYALSINGFPRTFIDQPAPGYIILQGGADILELEWDITTGQFTRAKVTRISSEVPSVSVQAFVEEKKAVAYYFSGFDQANLRTQGFSWGTTFGSVEITTGVGSVTWTGPSVGGLGGLSATCAITSPTKWMIFARMQVEWNDPDFETLHIAHGTVGISGHDGELSYPPISIDPTATGDDEGFQSTRRALTTEMGKATLAIDWRNNGVTAVYYFIFDVEGNLLEWTPADPAYPDPRYTTGGTTSPVGVVPYGPVRIPRSLPGQDSFVLDWSDRQEYVRDFWGHPHGTESGFPEIWGMTARDDTLEIAYQYEYRTNGPTFRGYNFRTGERLWAYALSGYSSFEVERYSAKILANPEPYPQVFGIYFLSSVYEYNQRYVIHGVVDEGPEEEPTGWIVGAVGWRNPESEMS